MMTFSSAEILANHARLLERNSTHLRFGYDPEASVRYVLGKALPLRGRVLDIGTGKGRFAIALARHVANLTTVDISSEEQHCARLEAAHAGVADRITFVLADARNLPWPAGSFHAVTSWNVFHHLEDPGRVFAEMLRVLKPTGKLILADFSMSGFRIMDAIHREEGRRHPHPPSRFTHWQARLHLAGFDMDVIQDLGGEPTTTPKPFEKPTDLKGMLELNVKMEAEDVANYLAHGALAEQLQHPDLRMKLEEMAADEAGHGRELRRLLRGL